MDSLWQQFVFLLLAAPLSTDGQNYRTTNLQRIITEDTKNQATFLNDCHCQDVNVLPGQPDPKLFSNLIAAAGIKGDTLTNIAVSPENSNMPLEPSSNRKPSHISAYSSSPAKIFDQDVYTSVQPTSIRRGLPSQCFYFHTPPSFIPAGVISAALNPPNIQTSEDFPVIQSVPFLIRFKQQSVNNNTAVLIPRILQNTTEIVSQEQSSAIWPGIYNSGSVYHQKNIKNMSPTFGTNFSLPEFALVERTNVCDASGTICPRCGFRVPPVEGCCLNSVQPVVVRKSKSKLRKCLPLIFVALLKGESDCCSGCCRCCNQQVSGIPIPKYPCSDFSE